LYIFDSRIDYLNSFIIKLDNRIYTGYYDIESLQSGYLHPLVFANDKKSIKNISNAAWCKYISMGFNSDFCNYPCGNNEISEFGLCLRNYRIVKDYTTVKGIILWDSYSSNVRRFTGYFTLNELETINEIKVVKKDSPNIEVFNDRK
jgi:hypothetical protein